MVYPDFSQRVKKGVKNCDTVYIVSISAVVKPDPVFKSDEQLSGLACDLIDNSIWYQSLDYQTRESWSRSRRVVCKVEYGAKATKIRFVVTTLATNKQKYCQRGEMENRFKEKQLELFSDRTSTHSFAGNQLRLWFSSIALSV